MPLEIKIGQIVEAKRNDIRGIVLEKVERSAYHKVIIYCIFAPYNSSLVGQTFEFNALNLTPAP